MQSNENQAAIKEMLKSFGFLMKIFSNQTTKIYDGLIIGENDDGSWNVRYNGEVHALTAYGTITPAVGKTVIVFIPQGNQNLAYFM